MDAWWLVHLLHLQRTTRVYIDHDKLADIEDCNLRVYTNRSEPGMVNFNGSKEARCIYTLFDGRPELL